MDAAPADGIAVVDKAAGWTSHDVVARARSVLGTRKVGHAGTLDPDATGSDGGHGADRHGVGTRQLDVQGPRVGCAQGAMLGGRAGREPDADQDGGGRQECFAHGRRV